MSKKPSIQVDLVIYKSGERIVIGRAAVDPDGSIQAQIAKDVRKEVTDLLGEGIGDISINPPPRVNYSVYSSTKTREPLEVAVVPPLKIQETKDGQA